MRIGFGSDIHKLEEGRKLMIGGILIPSDKGEAAHSDGDVLLHAIIDAILGAEAAGDIGELFPPDDDKWKDADSTILLKHVMDVLKPEIGNIDAVITLESPKLGSWKDIIRKKVASLLSIDESRVSIKAKTAEGLGDIGSGRAIKAEAIILIE